MKTLMTTLALLAAITLATAQDIEAGANSAAARYTDEDTWKEVPSDTQPEPGARIHQCAWESDLLGLHPHPSVPGEPKYNEDEIVFFKGERYKVYVAEFYTPANCPLPGVKAPPLGEWCYFLEKEETE